MIDLELLGQHYEVLLAASGVALLPGPIELATDEGALLVGQMVEDVLPLVLTTPLTTTSNITTGRHTSP
jgi:hypothetical protein